MPRRREVTKRKIIPDPKYKDKLVAKFTNSLMLSGKKATAEGILYGAFDIVKERFKEEPIDVFRKVVEINAIAPWVCSKYALAYLKESSNASIINAASTGSQSAYPNNSAYGTSKGGIRLQTQNLAVDLAPFGIRVNCYGPTAIATDMVTNYIKQSPDPAAFEKSLISTSLIPRLAHSAVRTAPLPYHQLVAG